MTGTGVMTATGKAWWILGKSVAFLVGTFVFSYIFWWTKGIVEKGCKKKKRK